MRLTNVIPDYVRYQLDGAGNALDQNPTYSPRNPGGYSAIEIEVLDKLWSMLKGKSFEARGEGANSHKEVDLFSIDTARRAEDSLIEWMRALLHPQSGLLLTDFQTADSLHSLVEKMPIVESALKAEQFGGMQLKKHLSERLLALVEREAKSAEQLGVRVYADEITRVLRSSGYTLPLWTSEAYAALESSVIAANAQKTKNEPFKNGLRCAVEEFLEQTIAIRVRR